MYSMTLFLLHAGLILRRRGIAALEGKNVKSIKAKGGGGKWKYMGEQDMLDISAKFAPYR